MLKLNRYNITH